MLAPLSDTGQSRFHWRPHLASRYVAFVDGYEAGFGISAAQSHSPLSGQLRAVDWRRRSNASLLSYLAVGEELSCVSGQNRWESKWAAWDSNPAPWD